MKQRLTESPDAIKIGKQTFGFDHPTAITFFVLNNRVLVASKEVPHMPLLSTLKRSANIVDAVRNLKDIGASFYPKPTEVDLDWYKDIWEGTMGNLRRKVQAGRLWKGVTIDGKKTNVVSIWAKKSECHDVIELLIKKFKLDPLVIEYIDSKNTEVYSSSPDNAKVQSNSKLVSKLYPQLSEEQIIEIVVKAHTQGMHSLNTMEKKVVAEFRGTDVWDLVKGSKKWGNITPAEWNYHRGINEDDNYYKKRKPSKMFLTALVKEILEKRQNKY